jgi:ABC-type uncharacterized transport system permease subunit
MSQTSSEIQVPAKVVDLLKDIAADFPAGKDASADEAYFRLEMEIGKVSPDYKVSGDIASDLAKPFDYYFFWLAQDLGANVTHLIVRGAPIMLAYALATPMVWPADAGAALTFAASLLLAMLVSFAWRFCVNITALWSADALGFARLGYTLAMFLSGFLVPVTFFPPWLQTAAYWTPFPSIVEIPVQIWLGILAGPAATAARCPSPSESPRHPTRNTAALPA